MFDFNLLIPTQCFRAILPGTLRALFVTAIKLAEKTPSPAGEGWGEGNTKQENRLTPPSSQPSPAGEGAGTCVDTYAIRGGFLAAGHGQ